MPPLEQARLSSLSRLVGVWLAILATAWWLEKGESQTGFLNLRLYPLHGRRACWGGPTWGEKINWVNNCPHCPGGVWFSFINWDSTKQEKEQRWEKIDNGVALSKQEAAMSPDLQNTIFLFCSMCKYDSTAMLAAKGYYNSFWEVHEIV